MALRYTGGVPAAAAVPVEAGAARAADSAAPVPVAGPAGNEL